MQKKYNKNDFITKHIVFSCIIVFQRTLIPSLTFSHANFLELFLNLLIVAMATFISLWIYFHKEIHKYSLVHIAPQRGDYMFIHKVKKEAFRK